MRAVTFLILFVLMSYASEIDPKYMVAGNCAGCHKWVVGGWKTSWHSKSHYSKNPLYKATLEFMSKRLHKPLEELEIRCAKCHNPRMTVKELSIEDIYAQGFGFKSKKIEKALNEPYVKDGINCIICHNIDHIKDSKDPEERGYKSIVWCPNDTMFGPFADAKSPCHKTKQGEHFLKPNKICFICHFNGKNIHGLEIYSTGKEYEKTNTQKSCVDSHMSDKREGRISNIVVNGYIPKVKENRSHLFMGARNGNILLKAFDINVYKKEKNLIINLTNVIPHYVPTGFASRKIVISVQFDNGKKYKKEIKTVFKDDKGRLTLPYLTKEKVFDNRFKPNEQRIYKILIPKNSKMQKYI
ncbi:multiheme c-type cytochrome [Nitrosophilus labii]|uniref:multiheme c-type cytochrome n=1 Tax=Nitrosophilus labii TaxID=2706014 RepID=UPI001656C45A|nr:multiheme c-type cytochrome [Nitrosophilus labii]